MTPPSRPPAARPRRAAVGGPAEQARCAACMQRNPTHGGYTPRPPSTPRWFVHAALECPRRAGTSAVRACRWLGSQCKRKPSLHRGCARCSFPLHRPLLPLFAPCFCSVQFCYLARLVQLQLQVAAVVGEHGRVVAGRRQRVPRAPAGGHVQADRQHLPPRVHEAARILRQRRVLEPQAGLAQPVPPRGPPAGRAGPGVQRVGRQAQPLRAGDPLRRRGWRGGPPGMSRPCMAAAEC